uniref:Uncharacterized protein n=1 Tax=Kalanchoe fedtschenkoi TaxID=63787 RepID=A0A7N0T7J0_KALFE
MNSMFSSFDFLCAELLGQSVKSSYAVAPIKKPTTMPSPSSHPRSGGGCCAGDFEKEKPETQKKTRSCRFAVELDGLNCFETLVYS